MASGTTEKSEPTGPNYGDDAPAIFRLPWPIMEDILKVSMGGHIIVPRPDLPKAPPKDVRDELARMFGKIRIGSASQAAASAEDLYKKLENVVYAAVYGEAWTNEQERVKSQFQTNSLLGWKLSCKRALEGANDISYRVNIFDLRLVARSAGVSVDNLLTLSDMKHQIPYPNNVNNAAVPPSGNNPTVSQTALPYPAPAANNNDPSNPSEDPEMYKDQPLLPTKYLPCVRAIHLSTRPLDKNVAILKATPKECLGGVKHLIISCADRARNHVASANVRHHIPHGASWKNMWGAIGNEGKFKSLETIEVNVCGWRVPPGWRREVLAPMMEAAAQLKGQVKSFDVYVPWTHEMVDSHNAAGNELGFNLMVDEPSIEKFKERAAVADNDHAPDAGWTET
ncbi:MAG: hypothetical protein Q9162_000376 [Coniocarpon cinnabarinum]